MFHNQGQSSLINVQQKDKETKYMPSDMLNVMLNDVLNVHYKHSCEQAKRETGTVLLNLILISTMNDVIHTCIYGCGYILIGNTE